MEQSLKSRIILRHDSVENWKNEAMPLLLKGEIGIEFDGDKTRLKVGDGASTWSELPYIVNQDDIQLPAYFTWSLLSGVNTTSSLTKTDLLQLVRPAYRDKVDIKVINDNMTLIDNKFSEVDSRKHLLRC